MKKRRSRKPDASRERQAAAQRLAAAAASRRFHHEHIARTQLGAVLRTQRLHRAVGPLDSGHGAGLAARQAERACRRLFDRIARHVLQEATPPSPPG